MNDTFSLPQEYRSGLAVTATQQKVIDEILKGTLENIPAKFIMLVDSSGQLVNVVGDTGSIEVAALGSLIAADIAASQEITRMIGEEQDFPMVLREGERYHLIIEEASSRMSFITLFSRDVPIGWARNLIQTCADKINQAVAVAEETQVPQKTGPVNDAFKDLFNTALDDIWKG
ncbi:MAG: hypothetical protein JW704_08340 [Anaerolineaceae bacterium]|nr:hypothetical protein [Anaerolineaceae bacterium]MBN2677645.1 hypothetical protein [Anaerolineaceae bacterium]